MKNILLFLLLGICVLRTQQANASDSWDATKFLVISSDYKAHAGPVWKSNDKHPNAEKTPPDFYRISVEKKTETGSVAIVEKDYLISEVDWPRLKKSDVADIIKYHASSSRVGFFLKGPHATFVYTMPFPPGASDPDPDKVLSPQPPVPASASATPSDTPSPKTAPAAGDLAKAKRFVPSVVYHTEKGTREYKTKRWVTLPVLEIVSKDAELTAFTTALHATIFSAAGPLPKGEGKLTVYIGPAKEVVPVRKKLLPQSGDSNWFYWSYWNTKRECTGGLVFITTDRMNPREARRALARSLMGVVGFPDESREYRESIMHPDNESEELALIDKRMISFIYKHTEPGIGREALLEAMNTQWQ